MKWSNMNYCYLAKKSMKQSSRPKCRGEKCIKGKKMTFKISDTLNVLFESDSITFQYELNCLILRVKVLNLIYLPGQISM